MFFSMASTTGSDIGQRLAAFKNAKSVGTRNRDRTSRQNFSSGSAGVRGSGELEKPNCSSAIEDWPNAVDGRSDAEPDSARKRAKSRRERLATKPSWRRTRRMYRRCHPEATLKGAADLLFAPSERMADVGV